MICEICGEKRALEKHHITSRCYGGSNKRENLCVLCAVCHTETHRGNLILETKTFSLSGHILVWHKKGEESITGVEAKCYLM
jgi:hypothetical protein